MISDLIEKTIMAGLGVISITREKAEKIADDLIRQGELARTEEAKFVKDLMGQTKKIRTEVEKKIEDVAEKTFNKLNIATKQEIEELRFKIDKLTKKAS